MPSREKEKGSSNKGLYAIKVQKTNDLVDSFLQRNDGKIILLRSQFPLPKDKPNTQKLFRW